MKVTQAKSNQTSFCLRLNTLRALACISVICTHIVGYHGVRGPFRSISYAGHMGVYFFFSLSGYLLSLSLVKEVRRRINSEENKEMDPSESQRVENCEDSSLIQIDEEEKFEQNAAHHGQYSPHNKTDTIKMNVISSPELISSSPEKSKSWFKKSLMISILGKYLWNRTLRLFPLYYGCWYLLKRFEREGAYTGSLQMGNLWKDILFLKTFPGHLWTMQIEMKFYYFVIPVYIIGLYMTFSLQKKGLTAASLFCFFSIMLALLFVAISNMFLEEDIVHPTKSKNFEDHLPPFCFGMLAALVNFVLEQKYNSQQLAKNNNNVGKDGAQVEEDNLLISRNLEPEELLSKAVSSMLSRYIWNIVCLAVFLRIMMLNPGVNKSLFTASDEIPKWQTVNLNSYWYSIFILINDTRGGFWKLTNSKSKPQSSSSGSSFLSNILYYFGLWSYPIYLLHPIAYVKAADYFPETGLSLEVSILTIFCSLILGGMADFIIDKMLINELILGQLLKVKKK